jgi:hypothetical protein
MRWLLLISVVTVSAAAAPVHATVLVPADLGELVQGAHAIVHGHVVAVESRWAEGRRRSIETLVTLVVEDHLKGQIGSEVTFRVPGGQLGPYRTIMPGAPRFAEGEDVIVFLAAKGPSVPWLVGLGQGVYRVGAGSDGVRRVRPGVPLSRTAISQPVVRGTADRTALELGAFQAEVRTLARARGGR